MIPGVWKKLGLFLLRSERNIARKIIAKNTGKVDTRVRFGSLEKMSLAEQSLHAHLFTSRSVLRNVFFSVCSGGRSTVEEHVGDYTRARGEGRTVRFWQIINANLAKFKCNGMCLLHQHFDDGLNELCSGNSDGQFQQNSIPTALTVMTLSARTQRVQRFTQRMISFSILAT